jgi:hypothetical protein
MKKLIQFSTQTFYPSTAASLRTTSTLNQLSKNNTVSIQHIGRKAAKNSGQDQVRSFHIPAFLWCEWPHLRHLLQRRHGLKEKHGQRDERRDISADVLVHRAPELVLFLQKGWRGSPRSRFFGNR